jgi:undecaprenyl-diphosphatase
MSPSDSKRKGDALPEQQLGDTPTPPWQMPTPEEKQAARPVKRALTEALGEIHSEEDAERVIDELEAAVGDAPAEAVAAPGGSATVTEAAQAVEQAAQAAPAAEKPAEVLTETAKAVEATTGRDQEAVAEAAQEVFAPRQQGAVAPPFSYQRELLRKAVLHRLKPYQAVDANLFIQVNHLPHTRLSNGLFYGITMAWNGGAAWYAMMGLTALLRQKWDRHMFWASAVPLTIATALVEHPIKATFRRRRPFISIVRAIVVGKKPGTWSFPSGHSASAFAGAWLLRQHFPRLTPLLYTMAALVAFSRVYLGDHYPSDVVTGSALGHLFAVLFGRLFGHKRR